MKRVKHRSMAVIVLALALVAGLVLYIVKFALTGEKWASSHINQGVYSGGSMVLGVVTDRNGEVLASASDGKRTFAADETLRRATLHAVGDKAGNIGTGALRTMVPELIGYSPITGTYSLNGEGGTAKLALDASLNIAAYKALAGRSGAVIIINYETGEIVCNVSTPTFDPENPSEVDPDSPSYAGVFLNRAISSSYTPGSSFKLLTAAAAIEKIPDIETRTFECTGSLEVGDGVVTCTSRHGELGFDDALAKSCNITFARLALELGADTMSEYAKKCGLTEPLEIDGIKTATGKYEVAEGGEFELAWSGAGQSKNLCSPVAMARFAAGIAGGGSVPKLTFEEVSRVSGLFGVSTERLISAKAAEKLGKMMENNVEMTYGTSSFPNLLLRAKSGTAEVGQGTEPHAWFVGYIENEGTPYAFAVIVENGGSGQTAAGSVANKVLQEAIRD